MVSLEYAIGALAVVAALLVAATLVLERRVEARFPPAGAFADVDGIRIHYIDVPEDASADLLPMVFIHGASGNARDLYGAFAERLTGRGRMVFVDRPGAGYSGRAGDADAAPDVQAGYVAGLLDRLGIARAVIIGHSLGGAVAAAFGVDHKKKAAGLVFIAPATHPWPGADIGWYYRLANRPLIGWLFIHLAVGPLGHLKYRGAVKEVFEPNKAPRDYGHRSATRLVLRRSSFRHNAKDIGGLNDNVARMSQRYCEITAPTVIITGDSDGIVLPDLHSRGLARDIKGSRLVWLKDVGHMPTYSATDAIVAEIERLNRTIREAETSQIPERPSLET